MTGHTPGPWRVDESEVGGVANGRDYGQRKVLLSICGTAPSPIGARWVAEIPAQTRDIGADGVSHPRPYERANALLIAQAPAMAAVLEWALAATEDHPASIDPAAPASWRDAAKAALLAAGVLE